MAATYNGQSGMKYLPWVLLLILLLLGGGYLIYKNRDKADTVAQNVATATPTASASASATATTVSDLASFLTGSQVASMVGNQVDFQNALVTRVTGDKTFAIGTSASQQVYVVLSSQLDDSAQAEQSTKIAQGQMLHVVGTVKAMPSLDQIKTQWSLNDQDATDAQKFGAYVQATTADVTQQAQ